jgi:hypothetical protein
VLSVASVLTLTGAAVAATGQWSGSSEIPSVAVPPAGQPAAPVELIAQDDTYASYAAANRTRTVGESTKLAAGSRAGDRKVIYLKFQVDAAELAARDSARVVLTRDLHHLPPDVKLLRVADTKWSEKTLTAANAPRTGAQLGAVKPAFATNRVEFDVSSVVTGPGVYSFAVTSSAAQDVARFRSSEDGAMGPKLVLGGRKPQPPTKPPTTTPKPTVTPTKPTTSPTKPPSTPTKPPTTTPTTPPMTTQPPSGGGLNRPNCSVSEKLVPSCAMWWGVAPRVFTSLSMPEALRQAEADAGRPYDMLHRYHTNGELFPTAEEKAAASEPGKERMLFLNYKPATDMTWRQVADGKADARIDKLAAHIKATYQDKFFLAIWHEPENDVNPAAGSGKTAADYAAMFKHTVQRLRAGGVTNAVTVVAYMGYPKWGASNWFDALYPGDDVVDWVGFDPYGSGEAAPAYMAGDFSKLVNRTDGLNWEGSYDWAVKTHPSKPVMLAEWGIYENAANAGGKAKYFQSVAAQVAKYPKLKALVYFDMPRGPDTGLNTSANSSAAALAAYRALGRDARFVGPSPKIAKAP